MNGTFNAFQMTQKPEITSYRQHIRLKKSMNLPDDTLEYWGFYLLKGATVALSVCSRFQGASILVVKGERNLRTCGMLDHNYNKQVTQGIFIPEANRQVKITFESNAQEINSEEYVSENRTEQGSNITNDSKGLLNQKNGSIGENGNTSVEATSERITENVLKELFQTAETYVHKHIETKDKHNSSSARRLRHTKRRHRKTQINQERKNRSNMATKEDLKHVSQRKEKIRGNAEHGMHPDGRTKEEHDRLIQKLKRELNSKNLNEEDILIDQELGVEKHAVNNRWKRSQELVKPPSLLDRGILHGGNAGKNLTDAEDESSVSSFENGLFSCYGGSILLAEEFEPSDQCINVTYLLNGKHMQTRHNVVENGYYYYIFYSDNDIVSNDIHALFDIYKPTFQYENVTKSCINQTECSFSLSLLSADRVIVEIPTKNGIEHEMDDINLLVSICHPRMGAYVIFPIAVLFFIISCAFM